MTVTESVRSALEQDKVESHLNPVGSFDVADHPVPTGREEIWRFTPLKRLKGLHADAEFMRSATTCTWNTPAGVHIEGVSGEEARSLRGISGLVPNTRHGARILAEVPSSLLVDVPADTEVTEPIVVDLHGEDVTVTEAGHVALRFGAHSKAIVVLNHTGSSTIAAVVEVVVGDGADVTVVSIQDWDDDAVHLSHHQALVGRDATYKHAAISFGGDVVRMDANVSYDGPGGSAELLGLYFADAGQHIEHRIFADHNAPHTTSNAIYKGALQGEKAHTVWVGNVLIRKVAEGIETYEENRNLVLTDGCRADSIPNLEIETGEIEGAGHASATARFDDEQLFYLQARGISEQEAQRLVVHGFFNDLIRKVGVPSIEDRLLTTVEAELAKNVLKEPFLMAFERACALDDVPSDQALAVTLGRYDLAVARDGDEVFVVEDVCSHAEVALSEGEVETVGGECRIECWLHGSMFDLRTGKPTNFPATDPVATFPAEIRDVDGSATVWVDTETTLNGVTPA